MADFLEGELGTDGKLHLMEGINSDSGKSCTPAAFEGDEKVLERAVVCTASLVVTVGVSTVLFGDSSAPKWTLLRSSTLCPQLA